MLRTLEPPSPDPIAELSHHWPPSTHTHTHTHSFQPNSGCPSLQGMPQDQRTGTLLWLDWGWGTCGSCSPLSAKVVDPPQPWGPALWPAPAPLPWLSHMHGPATLQRCPGLLRDDEKSVGSLGRGPQPVVSSRRGLLGRYLGLCMLAELWCVRPLLP
jgi:hypothetical protein